MINFVNQYWRTILILVAIFVVSVINTSTLQEAPQFKNSDKVYHTIMYASLAFTLFFDYRRDKFIKFKYKHLFIILLLIPTVYGGIIEIVQQEFFPPRRAEFFDWFADIFGSLIGFSAFYFIFQKRKPR